MPRSRCTTEHLSALDDFSAGVRAFDRLIRPRRVDHKTVKGINFFDPVDNALLHALQPRGLTSPGSGAPTCNRCLITSPRLGSHASFAASATPA
jgi:hypothetical protein